MKSIAAIIASSFFCSSSIFAAVTIQFQAASLRDSDQNILPNGDLAILLAVPSGQNFPTAEDLEGLVIEDNSSFSGGTILKVLPVDNDSGLPAAVADSIIVDYNTLGISQGDRFALYWFPGFKTVGEQLTVGQSYGFFWSDTVSPGSGGDLAMVFPADDGQSYTSAFFEDSIAPGSGIPDNTFTANFTVIPEPSSVGLALLGLFGLMARRRR